MKEIGASRTKKINFEGIQDSFVNTSTTASSLEVKELETKYIAAIQKLIEKYENLYNTHDSYKGEMTEKLNHYISLNNSLYSRNTELGLCNKEKNDSLNKLLSENLTLRSELEASRAACEKLRGQFSTANNALQMNEKFIGNMKTLYAQKEEEVEKWKANYNSLEQKVKAEKEQLLAQQADVVKRNARLQDDVNFEKARNAEALKKLDEAKSKIERQNKIITEMEASLMSTNANVSNLLLENESLKRQALDCERRIADLLSLQKSLAESLNDYKQKEEKAAGAYVFEGTLVDGLKQGKGTFSCPQFVYEGEFKNDVFCGSGRLAYKASGKTLEGPFDESGCFAGDTISFKEFIYRGQVQKNLMEGKGYVEVKGKFIVEGYFKNDDFDDKQPPIVIDLTTGEEVPTVYLKDKGVLVGRESEHRDQRFKVDFEKGTFQTLKSK